MITKQIIDPSPVWSKIQNQLSGDEYKIPKNVSFMGVFNSDIMAGAFSIKPCNDYCYEIHGGVHPDYWGNGVEILRALGIGLFWGTPCLKIIAIIPEYNRLMRSCVQKAGLKQEGILTKSFMKWSRMHNQYIYGITKGEARCQRQQLEQVLQR